MKDLKIFLIKLLELKSTELFEAVPLDKEKIGTISGLLCSLTQEPIAYTTNIVCLEETLKALEDIFELEDHYDFVYRLFSHGGLVDLVKSSHLDLWEARITFMSFPVWAMYTRLDPNFTGEIPPIYIDADGGVCPISIGAVATCSRELLEESISLNTFIGCNTSIFFMLTSKLHQAFRREYSPIAHMLPLWDDAVFQEQAYLTDDFILKVTQILWKEVIIPRVEIPDYIESSLDKANLLGDD